MIKKQSMINKNILIILFSIFIISCSDKANNNTNNNLKDNQTNEEETKELKTDSKLYKNKGIKWISHHYYMKDNEGNFFSVYLNDRWIDPNNMDYDELMPYYEITKAVIYYKNLYDINQFYGYNSILDIENNKIYAEAENGDSIESTYSNIISFNMTSKSLNSSSKKININSSLKAVSYNYIYTNVSDTNAYGSASTFSYKDSIFLLVPDNTNKLKVYDKISSDINKDFNLNSIKRNDNLELKENALKLFNNAVKYPFEEWITDPSFGYESSKSIRVIYFNDKSVSIKTSSALYLRGAHGIYNNYNSVYSLDTGEKIEITNFIKDFYDAMLFNAVKDKLISIEGRSEEDYLMPLSEITLKDTSFYIDEGRVHFIWSIYAITPYVLGETEIIFNFEEIKPFINEKYLYLLE